MSIHELLGSIDDQDDMRPWWIRWGVQLSIAAASLGLLSLLAAAASLGSAELGTSLRERSCSASPLLGLVLCCVAGLLLGLVPTLGRLHAPGAVASFDVHALVYLAPVPALVAALAVPGVLGCSVASDLSGVMLVGGALTGIGGVILAPLALALLGVALSQALHVAWAVIPAGDMRQSPGIVERAMLDAEALASEHRATRFHGVDSPPER